MKNLSWKTFRTFNRIFENKVALFLVNKSKLAQIFVMSLPNLLQLIYSVVERSNHL